MVGRDGYFVKDSYLETKKKTSRQQILAVCKADEEAKSLANGKTIELDMGEIH